MVGMNSKPSNSELDEMTVKSLVDLLNHLLAVNELNPETAINETTLDDNNGGKVELTANHVGKKKVMTLRRNGLKLTLEQLDD